MVKLAVVPLHVWLGKVHAEASTCGSVLLAGVGLKLGWVVACGLDLDVRPELDGAHSGQLLPGIDIRAHPHMAVSASCCSSASSAGSAHMRVGSGILLDVVLGAGLDIDGLMGSGAGLDILMGGERDVLRGGGAGLGGVVSELRGLGAEQGGVTCEVGLSGNRGLGEQDGVTCKAGLIDVGISNQALGSGVVRAGSNYATTLGLGVVLCGSVGMSLGLMTAVDGKRWVAV